MFIFDFLKKTNLSVFFYFSSQISTEEKGVNTRSRSLQSMRKSVDGSGSIDESTLAARRRRRRDQRANTTYIAGSSVDQQQRLTSTPSVDLADSDEGGNGSNVGGAGRRRPRPKSMYSSGVVQDEGETFFDAPSATNSSTADGRRASGQRV